MQYPLRNNRRLLIHELDKELAIQKAVQAKDIEAIERARIIQAEEYERRLKILNHEAEQLKSMQATYLPRETWENGIKAIKHDIDELKAERDRGIGRNSVIAAVVSTLIGIGFVILNFLL